jgi:hypothetical protein
MHRVIRINPHPENWTGKTWKLLVRSVKQILSDTAGMKVSLGMEAQVTTRNKGEGTGQKAEAYPSLLSKEKWQSQDRIKALTRQQMYEIIRLNEKLNIKNIFHSESFKGIVPW